MENEEKNQLAELGEKMETLSAGNDDYGTAPHKKGLGATMLVVVLFSSLFGSLFGFMAGGSADKFAERLFGTQKSPTSSQPVDVEKIVSEDAAVISTVEKATPAVVSIVISKNVPKMRSFGSPFDLFPDLFGQDPTRGQQGLQRQQVGGGSGFFVTSDGLIVTNRHVVEDPSADYTVLTNDGKEYKAAVLARDPVLDVALIKIEGSDFSTIGLGDSDGLKIGQTAIAIGNSLGEFSNTVSRGIISGLRRNLTAGSEVSGQTERLSNIIQTDAAINPGNSGGPLIDIQGNVIGVNVAIAQGAQNIGFALPINQVKKVIEQVKETGRISSPFLGVRYVPIDETIQKDNNLPFNYGVIVQRGQTQTQFAVVPGSPADKAGIVENDIILEVNGEKIDAKNPLSDLIAKHDVGESVTLKVWHRGENKDVTVVLEERK